MALVMSRRPGDTIRVGRDISIRIIGSDHGRREARLLVTQRVDLKEGVVLPLSEGVDIMVSRVRSESREVGISVQAPREIPISTVRDAQPQDAREPSR